MSKNKIIGITEAHGIAQEYMKYPPEGYEYKLLEPVPHWYDRFISSGAMGFYNYFVDKGVDLVEAPIFPAHTKHNWIYTPAEYSGTANFGFMGLPIPRGIRLSIIERVFKKDNFKKILFKSQAGLNTIKTYGGMQDPDILAKCEVVHPCVNIPAQRVKQAKEHINILFVGDFFRKGGANVVDAFEQLQSKYQNLKLQIIGNTHFDTNNQNLADTYRQKIANNPDITHQRVSREELLNDIYPNADIFASPTYQETFGFAILEAMAFGLPVVSTAHFAIPEIIQADKSGLLIETEQHPYISEFKGYLIEQIPHDFHQYMNEQVYEKLDMLLSDESLRDSLSQGAIARCKDKFSTQIRAEKMKAIYDEILG